MKIAINLRTNTCVSLIEINEADWHRLDGDWRGIVGIPVYWRDGLGAIPKPQRGWSTGDFKLDQPYHP